MIRGSCTITTCRRRGFYVWSVLDMGVIVGHGMERGKPKALSAARQMREQYAARCKRKQPTADKRTWPHHD